MKKLFLLAAAALTALTMNAQLNNPVGEDGRYIVKWDCEKGAFAAANDFEVDEVVTIAVDITGHWLADWVKGTPVVPGASRGVAINNWTSYGDTNGDFRRFKQINGNIYGLEMKLSDLMVNAAEAPKALMTDSVVYVYAQLFGFEFTATEATAGGQWWQWDGHNVEETRNSGADCFFATMPYTGTKTGVTFYNDDAPSMDMYGLKDVVSYAAPCSVAEPTDVENVTVEVKAQKMVENGQIILIYNGVRYNVLGAVVK